MISSRILRMVLMLVVTGLSSPSSLPTCSISAPFVGIWLQPGLVDLITINTTWCSLKGTCIGTIGGQQEVKNKFIFYNESTRCKRCILFIPRHTNALQYRESECFDADDDNGRICASITPDTVLYTLFRDNAEPIDCPFDQPWYLKKDSSSSCMPKAFHNCFASNTFQLVYNNRCQTNQDVTGMCLAKFSDGNINYVVARSVDRRRFVCFSYTKTKQNEYHQIPPNEIYLFNDETCRDLLNRESAIVFSVVPGTHPRHQISRFELPEWTQGTWLSTTALGSSTHSFTINQTQLLVRNNGDRTILHDVQFTRLIPNKRQHGISVRIHARSLQQCTSKLYCVKMIYRSSAVIDLSMGFDEQGCKKISSHYTLFKPTTTASVPCPQIGVFKSVSTYRTPLPVSTCSTGFWTLAIGCESTTTMNKSELTFSSTCRHEIVPDVQVITSIKGICLASWRTDNRFQRTLVLYEQTRTFCLIQPVKLFTAAWILSEQSCTDFTLQSIGIDNSLRYSDTCQQSSLSQIAAYMTLNNNNVYSRSITTSKQNRFRQKILCLFFFLLINKY